MTGQLAEAAAKRSVLPTVHAVSTPPPLQPVTNMFRVIDEALLEQLVHAGHQVVVVLARIGAHDLVAERAAVAGAAARVRVENHVAVGGHLLPAVVEADAVHAVRPAVDVRAASGTSSWRSKSGGVMYQPWIFRPSGDVYHISFDLAELPAGQDVVVHRGQLPDLLRRGEVPGDDVRRLGRRCSDAHAPCPSRCSTRVSMCVPRVTGCTSSARVPASGRKYRFCEP